MTQNKRTIEIARGDDVTRIEVDLDTGITRVSDIKTTVSEPFRPKVYFDPITDHLDVVFS